MATINGTNGDDVLTGTAAADTISPRLGNDSVNGAGGVDTLIVNYAGIGAGGGSRSYISNDGPEGFFGYLYASDYSSSVIFNSIDKIQFTAAPATTRSMSTALRSRPPAGR